MKAHSAIALLLSLAISTATGEDNSLQIRKGVNLLQEATPSSSLNPGERLGQLAFKTVGGEAVHLADTLREGPAVFVFVSTQCPLAKRYTTRLNRLHEEYSAKGVRFFAVFPNSDETVEGIREYLKSVKFPFASVRDVGGYLTGRFAATMTPQAFLIDQASTLRYRGAIDDQRYENRVKSRYLADALNAVVSGKQVAKPDQEAFGCTIHQDDEEGDGNVTYTGHIARIIQDNCQSCHRPDQVAPFPLTNYQEARRWQTEIKAYTKARLMPPWKASPGFASYKNDISLTEAEIALIGEWVDDGAPQGDPGDMPPAPRFSDGWVHGEPDVIAEMPEEYVLGPEGEDDYRHFIVPYEAKDGKHRFVESVDVRPGNRNIVHHVIAYVDTSGKARELDAADPGPGYTKFGGTGFKAASVIGGWAPGNLPDKTPPETGRWLPPKCDIVLQVHYYRSGVEERDRTKIGLYFSRAPNPVPVRAGMVIQQDLKIPPNAKTHEVIADRTLKEDSYLFSVTPHMHLLGQTMEVVAYPPAGDPVNLVKIDDWDFNWQTTYHLSEMQFLPKGTKIKLRATFDNSKDNPNNPHAEPKLVTWGERTTDEMCIAFFGRLRASEYDPNKMRRRVAPKPVDPVDPVDPVKGSE